MICTSLVADVLASGFELSEVKRLVRGARAKPVESIRSKEDHTYTHSLTDNVLFWRSPSFAVVDWLDRRGLSPLGLGTLTCGGQVWTVTRHSTHEMVAIGAHQRKEMRTA